MPSADLLSRETTPCQMRLLEASAGTGKTFAIEHLVVRLLIEPEHPLRIEQILIVTFTRVAVRELKARIRAKIAEAVRLLQGEGRAEWDYLNACADKAGARRALEQALCSFDQAHIFTIHGFCHRMLQEHAFEADVDAPLSSPSDQDHRRAMRSIVIDFFRNPLSLEEIAPCQLHHLLQHLHHDVSLLVQKIVHLVEQGTPLRAPLSFRELYTRLQQELRAIRALWDVEPPLFVEDMSALSRLYKGASAEWSKQAGQLGHFLQVAGCTEEEWDGFCTQDLFLSRMQESQKRLRTSQPPSLHYPGLFERLQRALLPLILPMQDPQEVLLRVATCCKRNWELKRVGKRSPDELLCAMQSAVQHPSFRHAVRAQYRALIVDEFQDTDPIQWEIFHALFLQQPPLDALYLVGDPKQSIYAFRNADVYTYLKAASLLGEQNRVHLDTNFRSTPSLVAVLNRLFTSCEWMSLPALAHPLHVPPVKAGLQEESCPDDGKGSLHLFLLEKESGRQRSWPTSQMEQEAILPCIAQEIQMLRKHACPYTQVAILVKDRHSAHRVKACLDAWQIPSAIQRTENLLDTDASWFIRELLDAILHPHDKHRTKQLLAGRLFGWSAEQLREEGESFLCIRALLIHLHQILKSKQVAACFDACLHAVWDDKSLLERMALYGDPHLLIHCGQLIERMASERDPMQLIHFMDTLQEHRLEEEQALAARPLQVQGCVTILTIHASKGLEFEVVFALGLTYRVTSREAIVRIREGEQEMLAPLRRDEPSSSRALQELDAEKMRQLYVAATRAKKRLYLFALFDPLQKQVRLGEAAPLELFLEKLLTHPSKASMVAYLHTLQEEGLSVSYSDAQPTERLSLSEERQPVECELPSAPRVPAPLFSVVSFSSMSEVGHIAPHEGAGAHPLPRGLEVGKRLHMLWEQVLRFGLHAPFQAERIQQLMPRLLAGSPLVGHEALLLSLYEEILHMPLQVEGDRFSLSEIPASRMQQEVEFLFQAGSQRVKGCIDLIFERGGRYYLLDWKSNDLGPTEASYTQERLRDAMIGCDYFVQASIYAEALMRHVKRLDIDPSRFGGAIYLFMRGKQALHFFPQPMAQM